MESGRHFDSPILSAEVFGSSIPYDLGRIRLLSSPVVVPENRRSEWLELEYQLQMSHA
jgi:hypothetical protein